jgi:PAS domain S-box-containing protein
MAEAGSALLEFLARAIDQVPDAILISDSSPISEPGPRIVYVNPAFERETGYSAEEVVGKSPRMLQGPKTDRKALDRIRSALLSGQPVREELVNYQRDGSEFAVELSIGPVKNEQGYVTHLFAIQRETTDQYLQRERLRLAHHAAAMGTFDVELTSKKIICCPRARAIFGLNSSGPQPTLRDLLRMIHAEDRSAVAKQIRAVITGKPFHHEFRILQSSGKLCWVEMSGSCIVGHEGIANCYLGVVRDISRRKEAEQSQIEDKEQTRLFLDRASGVGNV